MSVHVFEYPGRSRRRPSFAAAPVPLGGGPPFPHVIVAVRPDGTFLIRRALPGDPPTQVREAGDGPEPPPDASSRSARPRPGGTER